MANLDAEQILQPLIAHHRHQGPWCLELGKFCQLDGFHLGRFDRQTKSFSHLQRRLSPRMPGSAAGIAHVQHSAGFGMPVNDALNPVTDVRSARRHGHFVIDSGQIVRLQGALNDVVGMTRLVRTKKPRNTCHQGVGRRLKHRQLPVTLRAAIQIDRFCLIILFPHIVRLSTEDVISAKVNQTHSAGVAAFGNHLRTGGIGQSRLLGLHLTGVRIGHASGIEQNVKRLRFKPPGNGFRPLQIQFGPSPAHGLMTG